MVSIAEIGVDPGAPADMARIVSIRQGESFEHTELCFDQVEPGGFGGCPNGLDAESSQQGKKTGMIVNVAQVV